jgi:hypothetical protein
MLSLCGKCLLRSTAECLPSILSSSPLATSTGTTTTTTLKTDEQLLTEMLPEGYDDDDFYHHQIDDLLEFDMFSPGGDILDCLAAAEIGRSSGHQASVAI